MEQQPEPDHGSPPKRLTRAGARLNADSQAKSMLIYAALGVVAAIGVLLVAWSQLADDTGPQVVRGSATPQFVCELSNGENGQQAECIPASETTVLALPNVEGIEETPDFPLVTSPPTAIPEVEPGELSAPDTDCIVDYLAERFTPEEFALYASDPDAAGYDTWVAAATEANAACQIEVPAP